MTDPHNLTHAELLDRLGYETHETLSICHKPHAGELRSRFTTPQQLTLTDSEQNACVWFSVNPLQPTAQGRGKNTDVTRLAALWADLDIKPGGIETIQQGLAIIATLTEMLEVQPVAVTFSGHGLQPYWAIDDHPINDGNRAHTKTLLKRWGNLVKLAAATHGGDADSVYDLARIMRAPQTINMKNPAKPVHVATMALPGRPLAITELEDTLTTYNIPQIDEDNNQTINPPNQWTWAAHTCAYATKTIDAWSSDPLPTKRHPWLINKLVKLAAMHANACITETEHQRGTNIITEIFNASIAGDTTRPHNPQEIPAATTWATQQTSTMSPERIKNELGKHAHLTPIPQISATPTPTPEPAPTSGSNALAINRPTTLTALAEQYGPTEDGTARMLVHLQRGRLKYCPQTGKWLHWTGSRWDWDLAGVHRELIREIARTLPEEKEWGSHKRRALSHAGASGIANLARTDTNVVVHIDDLDANPYELNTPSGIVDLRTGAMRPPDPAALHTRTTAVPPDFDSRSPTWEKFLQDTFGGDEHLTSYVQRLLGISIIGTVLEQLLPFAHGEGANGKSTLAEAATHALGKSETGYAMSAPSEMLMARRHQEHPAELAQLAGARLVICSELDDGQRFHEARVKLLTGGDSINARFMRKDPFTFTPSHTLWLLGNHLPDTSAGGPAFWRRIQRIPFNNVVPEEKRDAELGKKLEADAGIILAWIIAGAAEYMRDGLRVPAAVTEATEEYAHDQDTVGRFVEEMCHRVQGMSCEKARLRGAYETWCTSEGVAPVSAKGLTQALSRLGITTGGYSGSRKYYGVGLVPEPDFWSEN